MKTMTAVFAVNTSNSGETVVLTTDNVNYLQGAGGEGLEINGVVNITPGATTTAVVLRVRRGVGTGGAIVGSSPSFPVTAGTQSTLTYDIMDAAPPVTPIITPTGADSPPTAQYTVTVQQTGGTAAGTVSYATGGIQPITTGW